MKKYLLLLFASSMAFFSCKKDVVNNTDKFVEIPLSEIDYNADYLNAPKNGAFEIWVQGLNSLDVFGKAVHHNNLLIHGSFYDQHDSVAKGGGVNIDTFSFQGNDLYNLQETGTDSGFFGRNITVHLTPPGNQAPQFSTNIYFPGIIYARLGSAEANIMQPFGDTIFWDADGNNVNGVDITISYDPAAYNNRTVLGYFPFPVSKTIVSVKDNGSFVIPQNVISLFPPGAYLNISISRGAAVLISYNEFKYTVHTYSYAIISDAKFP